jgi:DNA-binding NarL/FixJ family response regulator
VRRHLQSVPAYSPDGVSARIRVVVADDHACLRRTLRLLLEQEKDLRVVAEAGDVESTFREMRRHRPDVLVLDPHMPDGFIAERIHQLREGWPATQIVVVTMEQDQLFAERANRAGAIGFVLSDTADAELCDAVRDAARRVRYESPRVRKL